MTGPKLLGWGFKDQTPLWFNVVVGLLLLDSALHFGLLFTVSSWARSSPDPVHTYRIPFRDGNIYFAQPWLGQYLDARWTGVALLLALGVLLFVNRDQLKRDL